jgi:hypothetical protein
MDELATTRLGLSVSLIQLKGMQAAIAAHDKMPGLSYARKLAYLKASGETDTLPDGTSLGRLNTVEGSFLVNGTVSGTTPKYHTNRETRSTDQLTQAMKKMNVNKIKENTVAKAKKLVAINRTGAELALLMGLGKLVLDTAAAKMPKELSVLGPLVVAQIIAAIPTDNAKLVKAQEAALVYAMYTFWKSSAANEFLEELTSLSDISDEL